MKGEGVPAYEFSAYHAVNDLNSAERSDKETPGDPVAPPSRLVSLRVISRNTCLSLPLRINT